MARTLFTKRAQKQELKFPDSAIMKDFQLPETVVCVLLK